MAFPQKNYTLATGLLYFDKFILGTKTPTGQRYIGNTPEIQTSSESESLDHFDADNGIRVKDDSVVLELNRTGNFTTDHISPENLALFFLGEASVVAQSAATGLTSSILDVKLGLRYQVGKTSILPQGVRGLDNVVVKVGVTAKTLGTDYTLDEATGGVIPLVGGTIAEGADLTVEYDLVETDFNQIVSASNAELYGQLYYQSTNPKGEKFDHFYPYVVLRPDGDFGLKSGDEWQSISFSFEILKLDDSTASVYINGRPGSGV